LWYARPHPGLLPEEKENYPPINNLIMRELAGRIDAKTGTHFPIGVHPVFICGK
jgi:hypothetical protein